MKSSRPKQPTQLIKKVPKKVININQLQQIIDSRSKNTQNNEMSKVDVCTHEAEFKEYKYCENMQSKIQPNQVPSFKPVFYPDILGILPTGLYHIIL